jgi:hypothetical protein
MNKNRISIKTDKMKIQSIIIVSMALFAVACNSGGEKKESTAAKTEVASADQVNEYIKLFSYQDTYDYIKRYTSGEASNLNTWILGKEPVLVKAGEDKVVRMNNDTYYKMTFLDLSNGPVTLSSKNPSDERFYSFQLMDDHNTNFFNVYNPDGKYILYNGEVPEVGDAELIEVPSKIAVVIVRVEVKNIKDEDDLNKAKVIFNGITMNGPEITDFPEMDYTSKFDKKVIERGNAILDSVFKQVPFRLGVASPGQLGKEISILNHAAVTKGGWGGPVNAHSSYETVFFDVNDETLDGSKGTYILNTTAPKVDAFWSITAYDTKRGGYLHPNEKDLYHINGTTAVPNEDGTYTFLFKTTCDSEDKNCLEVPNGPFDFAARYYLPHEEIITGAWVIPKAELLK